MILQRRSGALKVCCGPASLSMSWCFQQVTGVRASTGTGRGMNLKTRLAKLERWLARRCRAVRVVDFKSMDNVYSSQTWMNVLVLVIKATHASLRTVDVHLRQREGIQVAMQEGNVLALSRAINQCQSMTHLTVRFWEEHSLRALGLAALPQSLQRLKLSFARAYSPGQSGLNEVRVLDLAVLRGLPQLTSVVLGPDFPLACSVPAGLSCLTELSITSLRGMVFEDGLGMPGLQRLALVPFSKQTHVRLPALQGLPGLTELSVNERVLVPRDLTPLRHLRKFCQFASLPLGARALPRMPVLPESLTHLRATGRLHLFPEQALKLEQLAYLRLDENCFTALPAGVTALSKLQYLTLGFPKNFSYDYNPRTLRILDAVALGDLSAFPCMTMLSFSDCQVEFSHDFCVRHHAHLDSVFFDCAQPCRGPSAAVLLALHRQLVGSGHRGVERSFMESTEEWIRLVDENA